MSFSETIFLFFLALIIFGPKKLPEIARQIGKALNEFRRASNEFKAQIEQEIANLEVESKKPSALPPIPAPEGTASRTLNAAPSDASNSSEGDVSALEAKSDEAKSDEARSDTATLAAPSAEPATTAYEVSSDANPATEAISPVTADFSAADGLTADGPEGDHPSAELRHSASRDSGLGDSDPVTSPTTQESHA